MENLYINSFNFINRKEAPGYGKNILLNKKYSMNKNKKWRELSQGRN